MAARSARALLPLLWGALAAAEFTFLYPDEEDLALYYQDQIDITFEGNITEPYLYTWCSQNGETGQAGQLIRPGKANGTVALTMSFLNYNGDRCWFELRNVTAGSSPGFGENSVGFGYLNYSRSDGPSTFALAATSTNSASGTASTAATSTSATTTTQNASSSSTSSSSSFSSSSSLSAGAAAGIGAVCGIVGVALLAVAGMFIMKRRKRRRAEAAAVSGNMPPAGLDGEPNTTTTTNYWTTNPQEMMSSTARGVHDEPRKYQPVPPYSPQEMAAVRHGARYELDG